MNEPLKQFGSGEAVPMAYDVHLSEIIEASDPRSNDFDESKRKETDGLVKWKVWRTVMRDDVDADANVIGGRFV